MRADEIIAELSELGDPSRLDAMKRFAIPTSRSFGISTPELKAFAREVKKLGVDNHSLAADLWASGIHEARSVAYLIDDPNRVTSEQMDAWASDFDNWATVDGTCGHLFCRTALAYEKAVEWTEREPEFEKRAAFSLMAFLAVHEKNATYEKFAAFLPLIEEHSNDERNFVKKAVNWALRQIGKRDLDLNKLAIASAERISATGTKPGRWIAADALRELRSESVRERLVRRNV
ncbi:MAG: DNA alkylation repair protein [Acidobacteriota bacterium]|nr:MAG: DNA alkylation repair protein [Acidobacteriota bacterium]